MNAHQDVRALLDRLSAAFSWTGDSAVTRGPPSPLVRQRDFLAAFTAEYRSGKDDVFRF